MQFTKTLLVLALPLLGLASPTPSNTALESRDITVDYAAIQALRQTLYDAFGQTSDIYGRVESAANSIGGQFNGGAAEAFQVTLAKYQDSQTRASEALLALAEVVGGASDSYNEKDGDAVKLFE